jgi:hypothetical protein
VILIQLAPKSGYGSAIFGQGKRSHEKLSEETKKIQSKKAGSSTAGCRGSSDHLLRAWVSRCFRVFSAASRVCERSNRT